MNTLRTIFHFALNLTRHVGTLITVFTLGRCLPYLPLLPPDHQQRGLLLLPGVLLIGAPAWPSAVPGAVGDRFLNSFLGKNISK